MTRNFGPISIFYLKPDINIDFILNQIMLGPSESEDLLILGMRNLRPSYETWEQYQF